MSLPLSPREYTVLQLMWEGMRHKEICQTLDLQMNTVKNIRDRLGLKLHARTSVQVIRRALEKGLIQL